MGIFNSIVRGIFTFVIPLTLINYYPMKYLTGESSNYIYGLLPIFAILFIIPAVFIFNTGLKKYKSSGS
jgi:ABC-2 type transport system permease protein